MLRAAVAKDVQTMMVDILAERSARVSSARLVEVRQSSHTAECDISGSPWPDMDEIAVLDTDSDVLASQTGSVISIISDGSSNSELDFHNQRAFSVQHAPSRNSVQQMSENSMSLTRSATSSSSRQVPQSIAHYCNASGFTKFSLHPNCKCRPGPPQGQVRRSPVNSVSQKAGRGAPAAPD